jgi:hypothetical protein
MDTKPLNPLAGHFRQPAIYINLPSNGQWWPDGTLELPVNGAIPVYPMTSKDELLLRTPDALMNGAGVVGVIQSCCPNILNAWKMPGVDVDAVLIAIRIASYGHQMDFTSTCPHCKESNDYAINLHTISDGIKCPDFSEPVAVDGLDITLKPQHYFTVNQENQIRFEEQRIMNLILDDNTDYTEKERLFKESMQKLEALNLDSVVNSTAYIQMADGTRVADLDFLREFYENSASSVGRAVRNRLEVMAEVANIKPVNVNCNDCSLPFSITITFDYSSFFALGS